MDYPIFPDEVKHVIEYLDGHSYLASSAPVTVAGDLKGFVAPQRWITVQATGGSDENPRRVAAPRVDVNVYAESTPTAKRIALAARAAMNSMRNVVFDDAVFIRVATSTPADLTDPVNSQPRFVFDATIHIRPN